MKKLLESLDECGMNEMPGEMPPAPMEQGDPVRMNVNISAAGKEHVADLMDMMKNAGMAGAEPVSAKTLAPRLDMERLRGIVDEPEMDKPMMKLPAPEEMEDDVEEEGYDNEPDPEYQDHKYMTKDLSGGLNREKKQYAKAQDGDNAMAVEAIKAQLMAALSEKKKPDADGDGVPDWADKKPGKDDNEGKKKGSKPKKGEVPPQFKKK